MKFGRCGKLRYNGYECYMEYDPELYYPDYVKQADAELVKEQNDYFAEQRRQQALQFVADTLAQLRMEFERSKQAEAERELQRARAMNCFRCPGSDHSTSDCPIQRARDMRFERARDMRFERARARARAHASAPSDDAIVVVVPNPPMDVVHSEVDIHIVDSATEELVEVPNALTDDAIIDVVPVATIDFPLQVADHSDVIADVKVDIGVDPIPMPVDLLAESIVVTPGIEPVHSEGSQVHSAVLVTDLKALQAPHVYVDPYLQHCRPLDFVVADFSTRDVHCFCGVLLLSFSVVEWTYGSNIFVFDPG